LAAKMPAPKITWILLDDANSPVKFAVGLSLFDSNPLDT
jgi:hypothetical protein